MPDELYGRKYELYFTRNQELVTKLIPENYVLKRDFITPPSNLIKTKNGFQSFTDIPRKSIKITDLRVAGKVLWGKESTAGSNSQESYIEVYNLSKNHRRFIDQCDSVLFFAGYEQTEVDVSLETSVGEGTVSRLPLIITGNIEHVITKKAGEDIITKVLIKDASLVTNNLRISRAYTPSTTYKEVIDDLINFAAQRGIPRGAFYSPAIPINAPLAPTQASFSLIKNINSPVGVQGLSVTGYVLHELQKLCEGIGYRAYTSLGRLYVEPISSVQYVDVVVITDENIKGSIKDERDTSRKKRKSPDNKEGLKISTFLNGEITLNKKLRLEVEDYPEYEGDYKITSITHKFDLEGTNWDTEVSCIKETR